MAELDLFHWAGKVSRREIRRLYASDAAGLLDVELLEQVLFDIHARIRDMFEVREAQQYGRVNCRACGARVPQAFWMGGANKERELKCAACGWQTTCGAFYQSYTGKDLLPGSRTELFQEFLTRFPAVCSPEEKMLLIDWLIHAFHSHSGVSGRLVAQNVIQGSRDQLVEMLTALAGEGKQSAAQQAWLAEDGNPIRRFRRRCGSRAIVLAAAAQLGIAGRLAMPEDELIAEILRLAPELGEEPKP